MTWLAHFFQRFRPPAVAGVEAPTPLCGKAHAAYKAKVRAIEAFKKSAVEQYDPNVRPAEQMWLNHFFRDMKGLETANATKLWLRMIDNNDFPLTKVDKTIQSLRTAIFVDARPRVVNVRARWEEHTCRAIVDNQWDITAWPERIRWLRAVIKMCRPNKDDTPEPTDHIIAYLENLAKKHVWARDCFLEQHILYMQVSKTHPAMFHGQASTSLAFATALIGIVLRTHTRFRLPLSLSLYEQAKSAWPAELAQLEATLQIYASMENTTLWNIASLMESMEIGPTWYSPYLVLCGETVYPILPHGTKASAPLELPCLD